MLSGDFWLYQYQKVIMANRGGANLPLARVKTIMKSSPEVETVTQESLFLITRATVRNFIKRILQNEYVSLA